MRREGGQVLVLAVLMMTSLLGMAALVLDTGSWFRERRHLQATADASALAGAQALPDDPATASSLALQYANSNGGGVGSGDISFESQVVANDTVVVHAHSVAPGFFSKVFGISTVNVGADAKARAEIPGQALYVAPIAVYVGHPQIHNYGASTELDLLDLKQQGTWNAPGSFGLIDLLQSDKGSVGSGTLAGWVSSGLNAYMPLGDYSAVPSSKFNDSQFDDALNARVGQNPDLLFPVYDKLGGPGSNAVYHIIGWVGFHVTGFDPHGSRGKVFGWFTRFIAEGLQATSGGEPDFGVRVIQLVQ